MASTGAVEPRCSRRRVRPALAALAIVVGAVVVAACGPPGAPGPGPAAPPDAVQATVYHRTNADRGARGLRPLAWDSRLAGLAQQWATYLSDTGQFHHRDLGAALGFPGFEVFRALAENLLIAPGHVDGHQMQSAWLASPSHAANIFGPYDSMGMGVAVDGAGRVRAVVNFGRH